jgi:hypothetical protein
MFSIATENSQLQPATQLFDTILPCAEMGETSYYGRRSFSLRYVCGFQLSKLKTAFVFPSWKTFTPRPENLCPKTEELCPEGQILLPPQLHPLVPPQVLHFMQVPLRTSV